MNDSDKIRIWHSKIIEFFFLIGMGILLGKTLIQMVVGGK